MKSVYLDNLKIIPMKNICLLMLSTILFFSCGNPEPIEKAIDDSEEHATKIESKTEEHSEEVKSLKKRQFKYLDDYGTIANREELISVFGELNLTDDTVYLAEGTVMKLVTKVINPYNWHHITYFWENETRTTESVEAEYYMWSAIREVKGSQRVEAKNGLYTGMILEDFVAWNGADITFSGFGWDYAGTLTNKKVGKLKDSKIKVKLINKQEKYKGFKFMIGDISLKSSEPRMENAPVIIDVLSLEINNKVE